MSWLKAHQSLRNHPKLIELAALLHVPPTQAIGHLLCLWWWAIDYAKDGGIYGKTSDPLVIANAAGWDGRPGELVEALVEAGWLDSVAEGFDIHDWHDRDHAGALVEGRRQDAERKRKARAVRGTSVGRPDDVQRREEKKREEETRTDKTSSLDSFFEGVVNGRR